MIVPVMMTFAMFGEGSSPAPEQYSGGFFEAMQAELRNREYKRRKRLQEERELEQLQSVDREIAQLLRAQEEQEEKQKEIDRLSKLVAFADREAQEAFDRRVADALDRYREQQTYAALERLMREMARQLEEEEIAVLHLLLED